MPNFLHTNHTTNLDLFYAKNGFEKYVILQKHKIFKTSEMANFGNSLKAILSESDKKWPIWGVQCRKQRKKSNLNS